MEDDNFDDFNPHGVHKESHYDTDAPVLYYTHNFKITQNFRCIGGKRSHITRSVSSFSPISDRHVVTDNLKRSILIINNHKLDDPYTLNETFDVGGTPYRLKNFFNKSIRAGYRNPHPEERKTNDGVLSSHYIAAKFWLKFHVGAVIGIF